MKNEFTVPDTIKEDIIQYLSGKLSDVEAQRLISWLRENDEHKLLFDNITDIWHSTSTLSKKPEFPNELAWKDILERIQTANPQHNEPKKMLRFIKQYYKVAATVLVLLGIGYYLMYLKISGEFTGYGNQVIEFNAPLGSRSHVSLPDGSKVWLNSGSQLKISGQYGVTTRNVDLDGEAYFVIAKNKHIPFIVHTSDVNITAVGTAFNVKAYQDEPIIETTLEEGSVRIEAVSSGNHAANQILLKPKEKAVFRKKSSGNDNQDSAIKGDKVNIEPEEKEIINSGLSVIPLPDTKTATSWKEQRWIFRHESLGELARKLERKYDVKIVFEDDSLKEYAFNGTIEDESIEQVFTAIRMAAPIDFKINHKLIELNLNKKLKEQYEGLLTK